MKRTYIQIDGQLIEKSRHYSDPVTPIIMSDIQPYQSMADGSMITSRSQHRAHLKQHNCIEIGNETMESKPALVKDNRKEVLREQLANMTHNEANKVLAKLRDDLRFIRR